ncbi:acyltransferase [Hoeflea sp. G2-23]|uniref:Acyltransferase n=1 Tax=Hoeflea algicola TaxID=2983763 RepID=A0ABT3Z413_9HYPH|nr:acyltransferase [Hoeflea algicola]MCY0146500.1 acyltransferase [Hoeflea algicola]
MIATPPLTKSSDTLFAVQYLRAAAALAVVFYHVSALSQETWGLDPERVDHVGAAGVDLFFVISGFIMAMIVGRPGRFDVRDFWIRRVARVVPAYWVITLLVFVLAWTLPSLFNSTVASLHNLFVSLSFVALEQSDGNTGPLLVVGWTLNYEMAFYVLVAVTAGLFSDRRLLAASAVIIAVVVTGIVAHPANLTLEFYTNPILLEFVFGILVYHAWKWGGGRELGGRRLASIAIFALGIILLVGQWERPLQDWRPFFWGVPAMAVLYGGLGVLTFTSPFLARLGYWSYALYITHVFVVTLYIKHIMSAIAPISLPWQAHYLIMTGAALAVAAGFYTLVERPLSRLTLAWLRRPRALSVAEPSHGA